MRNFYSYISRGKYGIGCTGQSVYVYENNNEILCMKGFKYTYKSCISPKLDYFALKSNEGVMYLYSFNDLSLVKKSRFMKKDSASQDDMFVFSVTGKEIISVDSSEFHDFISFYDVPSLELKFRLFENDETLEPVAVELTDSETSFYALIGERGPDRVMCKYYVTFIENYVPVQSVQISENEYDFYRGYLNLKRDGFTKKAKEWSSLKYDGYELSGIENQNYSLAELFKKYT